MVLDIRAHLLLYLSFSNNGQGKALMHEPYAKHYELSTYMAAGQSHAIQLFISTN